MEVLEGGYASLFLPRGTPLYTLQIHPETKLTCDACQTVLAQWEWPPDHADLNAVMEAHQCPLRPPA